MRLLFNSPWWLSSSIVFVVILSVLAPASATRSTEIVQERPVLYVNVVIEDASEAIKTGVAERINESSLPPPLKKRLVKHVGNFAADMVTASLIAEKAAPGMAEDLPLKMKAKGLTVHAEPVFQEGPYFVLMLQILHVDVEVVMEAQRMAGEERKKENLGVKILKWLLKVMGVDLVNKVEKDYLPGIVQTKMQPQLNEMMADQMYEETKMRASIDVLPEDKQARFFYALLKEVREEASKRSLVPPNPFASKTTP